MKWKLSPDGTEWVCSACGMGQPAFRVGPHDKPEKPEECPWNHSPQAVAHYKQQRQGKSTSERLGGPGPLR